MLDHEPFISGRVNFFKDSVRGLTIENEAKKDIF